MTHPKHPKEIALQECSPNHPLPQLALFFSDMGCVTGDETTLLARRPAWGSNVVGEQVQTPPPTHDTPSTQRKGARLMPRGAGEPAGLYVLCRVRWPH